MKLVILLGCSAAFLFAQVPGQKLFETTCGRCHGADGEGGEMGPAIVSRIGSRDDAQLADLIHKGLPGRGMPPSNVSAEEMPVLTRYLRRLARQAERAPQERLKVTTTDGKVLDGLVLNQGFEELTKKSLLARFIKIFPKIQSLVAADAESRDEQL